MILCAIEMHIAYSFTYLLRYDWGLKNVYGSLDPTLRFFQG